MMRNDLLVGLLGIGLGLFSVTGDFLPIDTPLVVLVAMANAVGPWIVVGFLAGSMARTVMRGAVLGATTLAAGGAPPRRGDRAIHRGRGVDRV